MKKTALLLLSTIYFFAYAPNVLAEDSTITAIPPKLELKADPGQVLSATLKVRNEGTTTENYNINVQDFIVSDTIGTPIPVPDNISTRWSLRRWIEAPDTIPVDAKGIQEVKISIKVPKDALPGGHYAMLTYEPNTGYILGGLKKTGSSITQRTGTIFYVTVNGPVTEKAVLKEFKTAKFNELGPVDFQGTIENLSDVHIAPKGSIVITDFLNRKVANLNLETGNIFPEASRVFNSTWNQRWGYGQYKAELSMAYGNTGQLISGTISFWLFPIRLVIYTLVLIIALLFILLKLRNRSLKHQADLEKEVQELKDELSKKAK